ncbi:MAG: hypothetical protein KDA87_11410 [Planctomycetales bacterium]|nr:hypothetical protein [Planctomycetales bacterium]
MRKFESNSLPHIASTLCLLLTLAETSLNAQTPPTFPAAQTPVAPVTATQSFETQTPATLPEIHQTSSSAAPFDSPNQLQSATDPDSATLPTAAPASFFAKISEPARIYRAHAGSTSFLFANPSELGWLSFESAPYLGANESSGITLGTAWHLLRGPIATPLPPRLYDFSIGYQLRESVSPSLSYDLATSVGVFSDFEDSAREGVRFPSHAVAFWHASGITDIVLGVEYLDRQDIKLLPVAGLMWRDPASRVRAELVFPRPRLEIAMADDRSLFFAGRLGGGSWDIERPDESNDVFTYTDYQITVGMDYREDDGEIGTIEFGYVFQRELEFREDASSFELDDLFMLRFISRH